MCSKLWVAGPAGLVADDMGPALLGEIDNSTVGIKHGGQTVHATGASTGAADTFDPPHARLLVAVALTLDIDQFDATLPEMRRS